MDISQIQAKYAPRKDNLLLILHEIQNRHREDHYITDEELAETAKYLGLPLSEVDGIVTFYTLFSRKPRGKYVIRLCDSLSCRIMGSLDLYYHLNKILGLSKGKSTKDGVFSLEIVNCLGCCDKAPNMLVNDTLYSGLDAPGVEDLINHLYKEASKWIR